MTRQAVVLAGGRGTRLGPLTSHTPKPLLDVGGRPFIEYLLAELRRHGVRQVLVLVGPFEDAFRNVLGDGRKFGLDLRLVSEPDAAGTGGALHYAREQLDDAFLLLNGDSWFDINLLRLSASDLPADTLGRLALRTVEDTGRYGRVDISAQGRITSFAEKTAGNRGLINSGIYWLRREILDSLPAPPCSLETDLFPSLVRQRQLEGLEMSGRFIDIGIPDDFARANELMPIWSRRPAAFLDRDGVLNRDTGYPHLPSQIEWTEEAADAIALLNEAGYYVFVVTNQAGIARGYYDEKTVLKLHAWMNEQLKLKAAHVDAFYFCPHHPDAGKGAYRQDCDCRKPKPGMLLRAMSEWPVRTSASFLVGDRPTDVAAAEAAGIPGHLYPGGSLKQFVLDRLKNAETTPGSR